VGHNKRIQQNQLTWKSGKQLMEVVMITGMCGDNKHEQAMNEMDVNTCSDQ